jgi:hypothetical protein
MTSGSTIQGAQEQESCARAIVFIGPRGQELLRPYLLRGFFRSGAQDEAIGTNSCLCTRSGRPLGLTLHANIMSVADLHDLRCIPGVGPSLAQDLAELGIRRVTDLRRRSPERLYQSLCTLRGAHVDMCVLYVFRCAAPRSGTPQVVELEGK